MKPDSVSGDRRRREVSDSGEADEQKSEDWLPEGWTVEVRARKNGRKDKCYVPPSSELKFYSRLEVSRYLNSLEISSPKTEEKKNGSSKRSAENVVLEKVTAEGLPPGWIKEIKVTKKGGKTRRDPYYTDPATGYVFRSMKDALRYIETGDLGRLAFKPKEKGNNDVELEDDKISSAAVAKKPRLDVSTTTGECNVELSSKLGEVASDEHTLKLGECNVELSSKLEVVASDENTFKSGECNVELSSKLEVVASDERTVKSSSCTEECPPLSGHTSDECVVESCADVPKANESEEIEKDSDPAQTESIADPVIVLPEKQTLENGANGCENGKKRPIQRKSKDKKNPNLPRRASKRLAGVKVDPAMEVKVNGRAHRVAVRESGEAESNSAEVPTPANQASQQIDQLEAGPEAKCTFDTSTNTEVLLQSNNSKHPPVDLPSPGKHARTDNEGEERKESASILPTGDLDNPEKLCGRVEEADKVDEKPQSSLDLPLDILTDPCIEFAIKTLTATAFDASEAIEVLAGSNSSKQYSGETANLATLGEHAGKVTVECTADEKQPFPHAMPQESQSIPEHTGKVQTQDKEDEKPGSPLDLPCGDFWTDPCIEFAVKTLTGAIPIEYDVNIQDMSQQLSSSQTPGNNEITLSNVDIYQADFWCPQFSTMDKPVFKQQTLVQPALPPQSGSVSFHGSGGTTMRPHGGTGARSNERQR